MLLSFLKLWPKYCPDDPKRIFVLRNNDIGDLLTTTPLFEALKKNFPKAEIIAGIGAWNKPVLENNPHIDKIITIDAPWHNKQSARYSHNSIKGLWDSLKYIVKSNQVSYLKSLNVDIGIDVLGSPQGSLLMLKAGIPYRFGVKGYAGGHRLCQEYLRFDSTLHVSDFALLFAKRMGAKILPPSVPQIFLRPEEELLASSRWDLFSPDKSKMRLILSPGAGFLEKCWPKEYFKELIVLISKNIPSTIIYVGSKQDQEYAKYFQKYVPNTIDVCGALNLREVFALTQGADYVISNSSMMMHVGAAFHKKTLVLLGPVFEDSLGHERLWSYPSTHIVVGKKSPNEALPTPEKAFEAFTKHMSC